MGQSNAAKMLAQLFKTIDRDDSGSIEKHEFLAYLDGRLPAVGATMSVLGAAKDKRDELRQAVLHANCEMIQELVEVDECNLHWDLVNQPLSTCSLPAQSCNTSTVMQPPSTCSLTAVACREERLRSPLR